MTRKEFRLAGCGFVLWFINLNIAGMDILPDFVGIILLGYVLYSLSKREKIPWPLIPSVAILAVDFLVHWFLSFELPFETLLVRILSIYVVFVFLGILREHCKAENPGIAKGIFFCRIAYIGLLAFDYLGLLLEKLPLMLVEVVLAWVITWFFFFLLFKVKIGQGQIS